MSPFIGQKFIQACILLYTLTKEEATFKQEDLARTIGVSTKQLARYVKKIEALGFCHYTAGKGRSHKSALYWQEDLHPFLVETLLNEGKLQSLTAWLHTIDDDTLQQQVAALFEQYVMQRLNMSAHDTLYLPLYQPITTLHPLYAADFYSVAVSKNLFTTLVTAGDTQPLPALAIHWEMCEEGLVVNLRRNVVFHDGTTLHASDVRDCLLQNEQLVARLHIVTIRVIAPYTIVLVLAQRYQLNYILALLSKHSAAIYKQQGDKLYGTGPYQLVQHSATTVQLTYFPYYFGQLAMIQHVQLITIPRSEQRTYTFAHDVQPTQPYVVDVRHVKLLLNATRGYFVDAANRQHFIACWHGAATRLETTPLKIGISAHKYTLHAKLKAAYAASYPHIEWVPLYFEHYLQHELLATLDAIMLTHAFTETHALHQLLDLVDISGFYARLYPDLCAQLEQQLQQHTTELTLAHFYEAFRRNDLLLALGDDSETLFMPTNLMLKNAQFMSELASIWKKEIRAPHDEQC